MSQKRGQVLIRFPKKLWIVSKKTLFISLIKMSLLNRPRLTRPSKRRTTHSLKRVIKINTIK
jgi:hypothetical protein